MAAAPANTVLLPPAVTVRMFPVPAPGRFDDGFHAQSGLPAQNLLRLAGGGHQPGRIARAPLPHDHGYLMTGHLAGAVHDLAHGKALPVAQIADEVITAALEVVQGLHMGVHQIGDGESRMQVPSGVA